MDNRQIKKLTRKKFRISHIYTWLVLFFCLFLALSFSEYVIAAPLHSGMTIKVADDGTFYEVAETRMEAAMRWVKESSLMTYLSQQLPKMGSTALRAAIKNSLNTLAYDTATWLGSGAKGQGPMFITEGWDVFLTNVADNAAGTFIEEFGKAGPVKFNLCDTSLNVKVQIGLGLVQYARPSQPKCTFSQMAKNWESSLKDKDFLNKFQDMFNPASSDLGIALTLNSMLPGEIEKKINEETQMRFANKGWLDVRKLISDEQTSPPGEAERRLQEQKDRQNQSLVAYTGDAFVDAVNVFLNQLLITLFNNLMLLLGDDADTYTHPYGDLYDFESGTSGGGGIAAAKEKFRSIIEPKFNERGKYEALTELAMCPDPQKPGPTNCVITDKLKEAIVNKITVGEAYKQGYLNNEGAFGFLAADGLEPNYNEGYPYRTLIILRKYRIIPVSWELAAQYIRNDYNDEKTVGKTKTIAQMIDCFSNEDEYNSTGYYRDWCKGLVDPSWVLTSPTNYCKREGPGPEIISQQVVGEGAESEVAISRNDNYCADEQTCIKEDSNKSCAFYGYCTEERRIWDFNAESCDPVYNTCQSYRARNGKTNSFLENTLNTEACNEDNVGCKGYCTIYNPLSQSTLFTVSQGGKTYSLSATYSGTQSGAEFYNYKSPRSEMEEKGIITERRAEIFIYYDKKQNKMNLGWIFGKPGTVNGRYSLTFESITAGNKIVVMDDPGDTEKAFTGKGSAPVFFSPFLEEGNEIKADYTLPYGWTGANTDGGMVEMPLGQWKAEIRAVKFGIINFSSTSSPSYPLNIDKLVIAHSSGVVELDTSTPFTISFSPKGQENWLCGTGYEPDKKVYMTKSAQDCSASGEGCHEFIRTQPGIGANLLTNPSFEDTDRAKASGDIWDGKWGDYGKLNSANVYEGSVSLKLDKDTHYIFAQAGAATGSLAYQTYSFSFYANNCEGGYGLGSLGKMKYFENNSGWQKHTVSYEFDKNPDSRSVQIIFDIKNDNCVIDALKLERGADASEYSAYRTKGLVYEKMLPVYWEKYCYNKPYGTFPDYSISSSAPEQCYDFARRCNESEVGCNMFTSVNDGYKVPAKVMPNDYCPSECDGYDTYIQQETAFESKQEQYFIPKTAKSCNADKLGCDEFTNLDKKEEQGEAKEYYSWMRICTKDAADTDDFYTWEGSDETGYQLKTFKLRFTDASGKREPVVTIDTGNKCSETSYNRLTDPNYSADCRQFYAKSGDISYKFLSHTITYSDDCHPYRRTELNYDKNIPQASCSGAAMHWDADVSSCVYCLGGGEWSDEHKACIYYVVPSEGVKCDKNSSGCRDYTGNAGNNIKVIVAEDFEGSAKSWSGDGNTTVAPSSVGALTVGGKIVNVTGTGGNPRIASTTLGYAAVENSSYSLTFLLKPRADNIKIKVYFMNSKGEKTYFNSVNNKNEITLNNNEEWEYRKLNLEKLAHQDSSGAASHVDAEEKLVIEGSGGNFDLDNIKLIEISDRYFLIKDSWSTPLSCDNKLSDPGGLEAYPLSTECQGKSTEQRMCFFKEMLGCSAYTDLGSQLHYLKSFTQLCQESAVGCEMVIDTRNTASPYEQKLNASLTIPHDAYAFIVYNPEMKCNPQEKGCTKLGYPYYKYGDQALFKTQYKINNVDDYADLTCSYEGEDCEEYDDDEGKAYFKDTQDDVCEWRKGYGDSYYWWKKKIKRCDDGTGSVADNNGKKTLGAIDGAIQGGKDSKKGNEFVPVEKNICQTNSDCAATGDICKKDSDCGKFNKCVSGFCHYACIQDNNDYSCVTSATSTIGFGGIGNKVEQPSKNTGVCAAAQSSCTEYIDPWSKPSPNIVFNPDCIDLDSSPASDECDGWDESPRWSQELKLKPYTLYVFDVDSSGATARVECKDNKKLFIFDQNNQFVGPYEKTLDISEGPVRFMATSSSDTVEGCAIIRQSAVISVSVRQAMVDYQLDEKIDKTTCNGLVSYDSGCVLFNAREVDGASPKKVDYAKLNYNSYGNKISGKPPASCTGENCDSNALIKVSPDRKCNEWLACKSMMETSNEDGKQENSCYEIAPCDNIDVSGKCSSFVNKPKSVNEFKASTISSNISEYADLSGYTKAGLIPASFDTLGYYPLGYMEQKGEIANVPNGNFESFGENKLPYGWTAYSGSENKFSVIDNPIGAQSEGIVYPMEGKAVMKYASDDYRYSPWSEYIDVEPDTEYIISANINTINLKKKTNEKVGMLIDINYFLSNGEWTQGATGKNSEGVVFMDGGLGWQKKVAKFRTGKFSTRIKVHLLTYFGDSYSGSGDLCVDGNKCAGSVYTDNILLKPALEVRNNWYTPQSCRLYPKDDSLSCDYLEDSGKRYKGWLGYCLEYDRAPGNPDACLMWWPVDRVKGDGIEEGAGYNGKMPVYYCNKTEYGWATKTDFKDWIKTTSEPGGKLIEEERVGVANNAWFARVHTDEDQACSCDEGPGFVPPGWTVNDCTGNDKYCGQTATSPQLPTPFRTDCNGLKWYSQESYQKVVNMLGDGKVFGDTSLTFNVSLPDDIIWGYFCLGLKQTVTPTGQNKFWSARTYKGSSYDVPNFHYTYDTWEAPFGSMKNLDPVSDPSQWLANSTCKDPLRVNHNKDQKSEISGIYGQDWNSGDEQLMRIFAESYGTWQWDGSKYGTLAATNWTPPINICLDADGNATMTRRGYASDWCGIPPRAQNIRVNKTTSNIDIRNNASISLTFNSIVDSQQLPLVKMSVDWGDGDLISISGIEMRDKQSVSNPHSFYHIYNYWDIKSRWRGGDSVAEKIYCTQIPGQRPETKKGNLPAGFGKCDATRGQCCVIKPKVKLKDNWGWGTNGINSNPSPNEDGWVEYKNWVVVTEK